MISCVIHTYNSEVYLEKVILSVLFCDEIVIIDMHSTDGTLEIAKKYGCNVFLHENIGFADPARAFGVSHCTHNWILAVDSDEIIPTALAAELVKLSIANNADVIFISRRNFMFGREILGSGWGYSNDVIPRFFKKEFLKYGHEVHNFTFINPLARTKKIISSNLSIVHFNYNSVSQFIGKLDSYTNFETVKFQKSDFLVFRIFYHFIREFFGRLILLRGYKDGWIGVYLALAMAFYRGSVIAKKNLPSKNDVIEIYKKLNVK